MRESAEMNSESCRRKKSWASASSTARRPAFIAQQFRTRRPRISTSGWPSPTRPAPGQETARHRPRVADKSRLGRAEPDKSESGVLTPKIDVSARPAGDSLLFGFGDPDLTNSGLGPRRCIISGIALKLILFLD
jgi:hypothetical protein